MAMTATEERGNDFFPAKGKFPKMFPQARLFIPTRLPSEVSYKITARALDSTKVSRKELLVAMGAGASTSTPNSPSKAHTNPGAVLLAPAEDCEEFDVTYTEWGELGLTLREQEKAHWVVKVNSKSAALGAKVGSILLEVNGTSVVEMQHREMLRAVSEADWPKTLKFRILKEYSKELENFQQAKLSKRVVDFYEVSFNEPGSDPMLGMSLSQTSEESLQALSSVMISGSKDPATTKGVTEGSCLISINGVSVSGLIVSDAKVELTTASWPIKLRLHGPIDKKKSSIRGEK
jgi:hypothetical protein